MFKLSTALIFINFLRAIYAPDPPNTSPALVEITPGHELPLVLFETITEVETVVPIGRAKIGESTSIVVEDGALAIRNEAAFLDLFANLQLSVSKLQAPDDSVRPEVKEGRLVKGTEFFSNSSRNQVFFCRKEGNESGCLAPLAFTESQTLECPNEAIPDIRMEVALGKCGPPSEPGDVYSIGYDICPKELPHVYVTDRIELYNICYNADKKSTIFAHHIITSPKLLKSDMLAEERKVKYPYKDSKFENSILEDSFNPNLESLVHPKKPAYKLKKLVRDENMPFGLLRKTTYKNYNVNWQHQTLAPLWDEINDYIRPHAIKMIHENDKIDYSIHTGVFDVPSTFEDNQMSNIWISMVTVTPKWIRYMFEIMPRGIVILMNNFTDVKTDDSVPETPSRKRELAIENYCTESKCTKALKDKFGGKGGRVRCCPVTPDIGKLFNVPVLRTLPILDIPGINVEKTDP
ncbi:uncharacterized protein LOC135835302 [Planococcus citri]|uniref:uncharacterized protein LOC135835302 n=1 Tax=Planococcus citri TaxID=170843 RepID=UPI0031F9985F